MAVDTVVKGKATLVAAFPKYPTPWPMKISIHYIIKRGDQIGDNGRDCEFGQQGIDGEGAEGIVA